MTSFTFNKISPWGKELPKVKEAPNNLRNYDIDVKTVILVDSPTTQNNITVINEKKKKKN